REAMLWYEKAAEGGDVVSQYNVGQAYYWGDRVKKDKSNAEKWLTKASAAGYGQATYTLALLLWNDAKTTFGYFAAMDMFEKGALQGNPPAAYSMGEIYSGFWMSLRARIQRDQTKACMWYRVASEIDGSGDWKRGFPEPAARFQHD